MARQGDGQAVTHAAGTGSTVSCTGESNEDARQGPLGPVTTPLCAA